MTGAGRLLILLPALLLAGCAASLPPIVPGADPQPCAAFFVKGRWQFTHTVAVSVAGKTRGALVGAITVDTAGAAVHCALMTVEGLVIFEAQDQRGLEVIRALPPFNDDDYARGMMADLHLLFLPPAGPVAAAGRTADNHAACRFVQSDGAVVDVIATGDGGWAIRRYDDRRRIDKEIVATAGAPETPAIARRMVLTGHGLPGYTLTMDLIDARPVPTPIYPDPEGAHAP